MRLSDLHEAAAARTEPPSKALAPIPAEKGGDPKVMSGLVRGRIRQFKELARSIERELLGVIQLYDGIIPDWKKTVYKVQETFFRELTSLVTYAATTGKISSEEKKRLESLVEELQKITSE